MTQTMGDLGSTLAGAGVDGAAAADFSEAFEADTEAPGVDSTPAEEEAGAIIIMAGVETTPETGGTRTTGEDFPTDFAGDVSTTLSSAINVNDVMRTVMLPLLANSPSKWGHDLFDEISKDEEAPAKESKEEESADVTAMDE